MTTGTTAAGRVEAIWIKRFRGGPMDPAPRAMLRAGRGIDGNANQGGRRQVTLIEKEQWERRTVALGASLDPSSRRANIMVSGVPLVHTHGRTLRVGAVRIRLFGETRPCHLMDEIHPGLRDALRPDWGGGAFGEILDDGEIRIGDAVAFTEEAGEDA